MARSLPLIALVLLAAGASVIAQAPPAATPQQPPTATPDAGGAMATGAPEVTLVLPGEQRSRLRLAFPAFAGHNGLSPALGEAATELEQTLRQDLDTSRIFDIQGPTELAVLQLTGDTTRDFELYRSLGNEAVLLGDLKQEGDKLVLEARIYDLKSGQSIVGKRYRGDVSLARRIAHTFADEVVLYFTGRRGIALTTIAFASERDGFKEIYLMDYDGRNQRRITAHKSTSMSPAWSPVGDRIAYVSFFGGAAGIYLVDVATGEKQPLVATSSLNISPAISPDGRQLAFARSVDGNVDIFVVGIGGGQPRRLTNSRGIDTNPAWSPTGREIAFTSDRGGSPQIHVMDSEGANVRRISFDGSYNDGATFSPDGTLVAYASRRGGSNFDIAVTNQVSLQTRLLTGGAGTKEAPSFSPDGRKLAFHLTTGRSSQIYSVDVDGTNLTQLTYTGQNTAPDWSGYPR